MTRRRQRWIVDEPVALTRLVAPRVDAAEVLIGEGRVFVDGVRAAEDVELQAGAVVDVHASRPARDDVEVLGRRGHLVVVFKPPSMPCEPDRSGSRSVQTRLAARLGERPSALHVVGRVDVGVSGVVLVAVGPAGKREAAALVSSGSVSKRYVAMTSGEPSSLRGTWTSPICGKPAKTTYVVVASARRGAARARATAGEDDGPLPCTLCVELATGRKHQIRAHASGAGVPLLGDRRYGGPTRFVNDRGAVTELRRIALHALGLSVRLGGVTWEVVADVPDELSSLWSTLGGDPRDLVDLANRRPIDQPGGGSTTL